MWHLDKLLGQGQVHLGRNWLLQFSTFSLKIFERKSLILFLMKWDLFLICSGGERKCWMNLCRAVGFVSIFTAVAFYAIFSKHSALMPFYIISESLQGRSIQEVITNLWYQFQQPLSAVLLDFWDPLLPEIFQFDCWSNFSCSSEWRATILKFDPWTEKWYLGLTHLFIMPQNEV